MIGLVFSLPDALNVLWGTVSDQGAGALHRRIDNHARAKRVAGRTAERLTESIGVKVNKGALRSIVTSKAFEAWLRSGSEELAAPLDNELDSLVEDDTELGSQLRRQIAICLTEAFEEVVAEEDPGVIVIVRAIRMAMEELVELVPNIRTSVADSESRPAVGLDEALAIVQTIPLGLPPSPGPLPLGSRMSIPRNPLFVGRKGDLEAMARALKAQESLALSQVVAATGMGGLGKTQLAIEFVHRYGRFFAGGVYWVSFARADQVPMEVADCGGRGFMELHPRFTELAHEERVRLVQRAWESAIPRLLIFDNCEDEALVTQWRPPIGGCRVLITARRSNWDPVLGITIRQVDLLHRSESVDLLRKFLPEMRVDDQALNEIADELGDLPLALHLAGSYLRNYRAVVDALAYLTQLREPDVILHASLLGRGPGLTPNGHIRSVAQSFSVSFGKLDTRVPVDSIAIDLLARAACLAPGEPILPALLLRTLRQLSDGPDVLLQADGLNRLGDELGLLMWSDDGYRLHRLLAQFIRGQITDERAKSDVEEALVECSQLADSGHLTGQERLSLIPHLRFVAEDARDHKDLEKIDKLEWALAMALWTRGDYVESQPLFERILSRREASVPFGKIDTAHCVKALAWIHFERGDLTAAEALFRRALQMYESTEGLDHVDTASALNGLGKVLVAREDSEGAVPIFKRALDIKERRLGPKDETIATSLESLGMALQASENLAEAQPLLARALADSRRGPRSDSSLHCH